MMTSNNDVSGQSPQLPKTTGTARLTELGQMFELGNKMALYDAVAVSRRLDMPLPDWAIEPLQEAILFQWMPRRSKWKGSKQPIDGGFVALLARYVRAEVYRSAMAWIKNKSRYRNMPTRCIQAWYDHDLDDISDGEKGALDVAMIGLKDTVGECKLSVLIEHRYFGADPEADKLEVFGPEITNDAAIADAGHLEMDAATYSEMIKSEWRDFRRLHLAFGYNETEVLFGFRPPGQFWGPPYEPPEHIQKQLSAMPETDFPEENL